MSLEPDIILSDVVSAGSSGGLIIYSDTKFIITLIIQESVFMYVYASW